MDAQIKLAHANATQITSKGQKSDWVVKANITGEELGTLPSKLTENEVFSILDLARKYELEAFNIGINFGKQEYKKVYEPQIKQLQSNLQRAKNENERISEALDKATKSKS